MKNAIEEGKRIPKRMEMSSDLGMCVYYSAKGRGR